MRYDYSKVHEVIANALNWLGEDRFSKMRVTELEHLIREKEKTTPLPSRTQFHAAIHEFRMKRWPDTAPRLRS